MLPLLGKYGPLVGHGAKIFKAGLFDDLLLTSSLQSMFLKKMISFL